jgi:GntR family transcriptional regulator
MHLLVLTPRSRLLSYELEPADEKVAAALAISPGDEVVHIERLRFANEEPMALNTSVIPRSLVPELTKNDLEEGSLYEILEHRYGLLLARAEQTLEPALADSYVAELLGVSVGAPLLLVDGVVYLKNGIPIEWVQILYRGDRYKFHIVAVR